jgi:Type I restriction enzyme R protein N terminus (HSDR_N)
MFKVPKKFTDRCDARLKHFRSIAVSHRQRDVSEADTVTLIKDILAEVFGFEKYTELTSEQQIRGTFCDLAVKIDGKIRILIEVKSAGSDLSESHLRQALNYGANQGIEWIILTNSVDWRLYKIKFSQPIEHEEVSRFDITNIDHKKTDDLNKLFLISREGIATDAMFSYHQQILLLNRYTVAQVILSEACVSIIRREFRKIFPEVKVEDIVIMDMLANDIIKRDALEGEKVKEAKLLIKKSMQRAARVASKANAPEQP